MSFLLRIGAGLGFVGVMLGAFGAHALRDKLPPQQMAVYQTGVQYHLLHAAVIVALGLSRFTGKSFQVAGWLFVAGTLVFSGSLYALAATDVKVLGAITPIGGVCFLAGWATLALGASQGPKV